MSNYPTKKLVIYTLAIVIGIVFVVVLFQFPEYSSQFGTLVLAITLGVLILYAYDTNRIAEESVKQTELQTRPIMTLHIRYISGVSQEEEQKSIREKYAITHVVNNGTRPSPFFVALRNTGKGPAFNVVVESKNFIITKYQTRFFAPLYKNEHAIKIIKKPDNKIRDLAELKDEIFVVRCQSALGKEYEYTFKIIDIEARLVEFIV